MNKIKKTTWNTYASCCYTHDVANDQASAGGVHLHQIRHHHGHWQTRICQSNGQHQSYSDVSPVDPAAGEACFATACQ